MFGRVTRFTATPQRFDEMLNHMLGALVRYEGGHVPGWLGGKVMADRESGEIRTVSYWPTREAAEQSASAALTAADFLSDDGIAGAEVKIFEVMWIRSPEDIPLPEWTSQGWPPQAPVSAVEDSQAVLVPAQKPVTDLSDGSFLNHVGLTGSAR